MPPPSRPTKPSTKSNSVDELADKLGSGLKITNGKPKPKPKVSPGEQRVQAMRAVNAASQSLSSIMRSVQKKIPAGMKEIANSAATNLKILRDLCPGDVDVERAAVSVLGKLIALEMFDAALAALGNIHGQLCRLTQPDDPIPPTKKHHLHLISLPISISLDTTLSVLISNYLLHAITTLLHHLSASHNISLFAQELTDASSFLTWIPHLTSDSIESLIGRVYSTLNKVSTQSDPHATFLLRSYALSCLAYSNIDALKNPDNFWEQAYKISSSYARSASDPATQDQAARTISSCLAKIVEIAETRKDKNTFVCGKGFFALCEYWISIATKAGGISTIDQIVMKMRPAGSSVTDAETELNDDALLIAATKLIATITQTTAALDPGPPSDDQIRETTELLKTSPATLALVSQTSRPENVQRVLAKLERAIERLRRAVVNLIETQNQSSLRVLLEPIIGVLSQGLESNPECPRISAVLDSLFALSRTSLNVNDLRSCIPSYNYLERAMVLLRVTETEGTQSIDTKIPLTHANYIRCLSGVFHNTAGTLYQAGRYASAIGFLKEGCRLGSLALTLWKSAPDGEGSRGKDDSWNQLQTQLHRRWQLLAVCYSKTEDRKLAFDSLVQCIKTFPYSEAGVDRLSDGKSPTAVFASSSALQELSGIIERMTILAASELLLPPHSISLHSLAELDPRVRGLLLEKQLDCLELARNKEHVSGVLSALTQEAIRVYEEANMPLRKTRVLLRALELAYYLGPGFVAFLGSPDDVVRSTEELVTKLTFGPDQNLSAFASQFRASAHLLAALHAHRRADPNQVTLVGQHVSEACGTLKTLLHTPSAKSIPSPPKKSPPKRTVTAATRKTRGTVAKVTAKPPPVPPKTPRKRAPKVLQEVSLNVPTTPPTLPKPLTEYAISLVIDDVDRLTRLLSLTSQILGLLSLVLPRLYSLDILRTLWEQYRGQLSDEFVIASADLGSEYLRLGKTKRAATIFSKTLPAVQAVSVESQIIFYLRYAESFALVEDLEQSVKLYLQALSLSQNCKDGKTGSSLQRIQNRVGQLERAATAAYVFSVIQYFRDDASTTLPALLQSLRLWNRAFDTLIRLQPPSTTSKSSSSDEDPFRVTDLQEALPSSDASTPRDNQKPTRTARDSLEWRISNGLLNTMFALSKAYKARGSVREAEYFADQAKELAESLNAPVMIARAMSLNAELKLLQGLLDQGLEIATASLGILKQIPGAETAEVLRLRAEYDQRTANLQEAHEKYELSKGVLDELNRSINDLEVNLPGQSSSPQTTKQVLDVVFPELLAKVLHEHVWLLRDQHAETYALLVEKLLRLPKTLGIKAEENILNAKLALHGILKRFRSDIYLSSIAESTIALPLGSSSTAVPMMTLSSQEMLNSLDGAEKLFWTDLAFLAGRAGVFHVRETMLSLATLRAFQTSLGRLDTVGPQLIAALLDHSSALTLRREMAETIFQKCFGYGEDLQWPAIDDDGKHVPKSRYEARNRLQFGQDMDDDDLSRKSYWLSLLEKYQSFQADPTTFSVSDTQTLPTNWTVVHISVTSDHNTLFVSRQRGGSPDPPLVFCIPLKGRREDDNDQHLTFEDAIKEFKDIVRLNNETTKSAINVKEHEAKVKWWKARRDLDTRMRELVENIEFCWLGAFKSILNPRPNHPSEVIANLRLEFDKVFQAGLHLQDKKTKERALGHKRLASESLTPNRVTLDDELVQCFSTLTPQCRDEELEDLVYFILDLYQFYGITVAIAEIDVTQVVIDLRSVLEGHAANMAKRGGPSQATPDEHVFLVLDKNVQGLPWENIPTLRGRSVSRVPSVDFLLDRVTLARWQNEKACRKHGEGEVVDRAVVDPRNAYYILNPSGDLLRTENRFKDWLKGMESVGWRGLVGSAPSEHQMENALEKYDLVLYFGHGGGEQYIRSHRIRQLKRCGALMLWGCSSGALHENGEFDRTGTPFNYMVAGCPTLVANLWDVTDGDLDKFTQAVIDKVQLTSTSVQNWNQDGKGTSLVAAVAQSRDACKLKYLTGAAPVVYGIPLYL